MRSDKVDTIVIGGGPAGSTTAALLAKAGVSVLLIEKEAFPRFHIGESLLPRSVPILERLEVDPKGPAFHYKGGAEFFDESTGDHAVYPFADALPGIPPHAYQVDRAVFDAALLDRARAFGTEVHEGERVKSVDVDNEGVRIRTDRDAYAARFCVDATGQDAFFARRDKTTVPIESFGRAAVFTHYEGLSDDAIDIIGPDGNIKVLMGEAGWGWLIPLSGKRLSVGAVTRNGGVTPAMLEAAIEGSSLTKSLIDGATRLSTRVIRNFSYKNGTPSRARCTSVGDAACFLDPVFSSGVALAMLGAEAVCERLVPALAEGREGDPDLMTPVWSHMERAYESMGSLIYAFYHTGLLRNLFFAKRPDAEMRAGLISILALDVWRTDNAFQEILLRSRRRQTWTA
jgi:flavin-dependent dehydrogenase